jgi:uncharacterized protein (TIGR02145 family)
LSTLTTYLNGTKLAGAKLKEAAAAHWFSPNLSATNSTGFTALPGGSRSPSGKFVDNGTKGTWWSSVFLVNPKLYGKNGIMLWNMNNNNKEVEKMFWLRDQFNEGYSVRCIKDN